MQDNRDPQDQAARDVTAYLSGLPATINVENVEDDPRFRRKDIDLLWRRQVDGRNVVTTVEVKGDRQFHTGNYFLETISNEGLDTPGCFLYTEAEFVFYYFVEPRELHIIPVKEGRAWFKRNLERFREARTSTPAGTGDYVTVGRLVPRDVMRAEVKGIDVVQLRRASS